MEKYKNQIKVVLSHPTANAFVRAAVKGLLNAGMLSEFNTTIATFPGNIFDKMSGISPFKEFKRRSFDPNLEPFTDTYIWYELGRFAARKTGLSKLSKHETGLFCIDNIYHTLDKWVANKLKSGFKRDAGAVYAYEDGALSSFCEAKSRGLICLYDLPIGYWRTAQRLLDIERERWPDWAPTLTSLKDSKEKLERKDEELKLADHIFVASSFTATTLNDYPGKLAPIETVPYAFPPVYKSREYQSINGRPLKLLFVGGLSQRKGIADLFAAVEKIGKRVELTVVGLKAFDNCLPLDAALAKHKWIPGLPHAEILKLMRQHDVLVFPSLFEGFGLVITEAMSQGTPVITTDRTAGPDLISHNENGWLIRAGSTDTLQLAIEEILLKPGSVEEAGRSAMNFATRRTWDLYGQELATAIFKLN